MGLITLGGWFGKIASLLTKRKMVFGIDVSHHNGKINWSEVAKNTPRVDYVFIKATEGRDFMDKKFLVNSKEAKLAGLQVGYYHFASLNNRDVLTDATEEARDFVDAIKYAPKPDLPPVLDIEENDHKFSPSEIVKWVNKFMMEMDRLGYPDVIIYSYSPFLRANLPAGHPFGRFKLWLAGYVHISRLVIPHGWTRYYIWQYSAKGRVRGIVGDVDLNTTKQPEEFTT